MLFTSPLLPGTVSNLDPGMFPLHAAGWRFEKLLILFRKIEM